MISARGRSPVSNYKIKSAIMKAMFRYIQLYALKMLYIPSVISSTSPLSPKHLVKLISISTFRRIGWLLRLKKPSELSWQRDKREAWLHHRRDSFPTTTVGETEGLNSLCELPGRCTWIPVYHFLSINHPSLGQLANKQYSWNSGWIGMSKSGATRNWRRYCGIRNKSFPRSSSM